MRAVPVYLLLLLAVTPALDGQAARPTPDALARATAAFVTRAFDLGVTPGLGVAVVLDGRTIYQAGLGSADRTAGVSIDDRSLWYIASTSKSFTGFALSLLAERGALRFDAPIATLLPDARWATGVDPSRLTLADFLAHRSGLSGGGIVLSTAFTGTIPEADLPRWLHLNAPTGSDGLAYSNLGYEVGAMVVSRIAGDGWRAFQAREIFAPAGMHDTYARRSGLDDRRIAKPHDLLPDGTFATGPFLKTDRTMSAAGGHLATLSDLARWVIVQCDSGRIEGRQVFPAAAVARGQTMLAAHTQERARRFAMFDRRGWGAGWDVGAYEGERMISRFGGYGTTRSHLSFLPGRRVGVVAMATGGAGSWLTDAIAAYVYDLEAGRADAEARGTERLQAIADRFAGQRKAQAEEEATRRARQATPLRYPLEAWTGTFRAPGYGAMAWEVRGDGLWFTLGDVAGPAEIYDASTDRLRIEIGGGVVAAFTFDERGRAVAIEAMGITFRRDP